MNCEILYRPAHSMARLGLLPGETVVAEPEALVGMSLNVHLKTGIRGGVLKGLSRLFGGESFFTNQFTAEGGPGELLLAHKVCGDMAVLDVDGAGYFVQSSSFIAAEPGVRVETQVGGFRLFFAGEGLFMLKASGRGKLVVGAFGALERIDIDGRYVIDTGHLVAWQAGLSYRVTKAGSGWISSFLSGEGLVCEFEGRGTVYLQTRNPAEYGRYLGELLPPRRE